MGTRSLTFVYDRDEPVVCMYAQYDGYPSGHGLELANFLLSLTVVNGLGMNDNKVANGMGCLAAQLIAHFKSEPGGYYLYPMNSRDVGEEYTYHIHLDNVSIISYNNREIFNGSWKEFLEFCSTSID